MGVWVELIYQGLVLDTGLEITGVAARSFHPDLGLMCEE
jgi:hypothetical protein